MKPYSYLPSLDYLLNSQYVAAEVYKEYQEGLADVEDLDYYDSRADEAKFEFYEELNIAFLDDNNYNFSFIEGKRTIIF